MIYTRTIVSSISLNVLSVVMESEFYVLSVQYKYDTDTGGILRRHVLSGSYNNYFHIYDREAQTDTVLQADKSAFKAKKIGGSKGAKPTAVVPKKLGGTRPAIDVESIDFNKKILHGALLFSSYLHHSLGPS